MSEHNDDDLEFIPPEDIFEALREHDGEGVPPWHGLPPVNAAEGQTDTANARRFVRQHGDRVRYVHQWGRWLVWDGCRWKHDDDGAVMRLAKATADSVWSEARQFDDSAALRFAARTASAKGVQAMLSLAQSEVPVLPSDLDGNTMLLTCPNGVVDLRTGELREHRREDYCTKLCPTEFDADAPSIAWDQFQEDVSDGDDGLIRFKQRLYGYCATGDVREQILPVFYGSGSNGKTTEAEAITGTLGMDFCGAAPKDLLMQKRGESHPTEIADLHGKRLIIAQETEHSRTLNESLVKALTGGDSVKARRMREDFWQFNPTHKLILCTNHKPRVKGTDHAIWRRLRLVPYAVRFDGDRRDKSMPDKLRKERPGILSWIVKGALDWQAQGLGEPSAVEAATAAYRSDSDTIGRFILDSCIVGTHLRVKFSDFNDSLDKWCKDGGENTPSRRVVGEYLQEQGFTPKMSAGRWYEGLGIRYDESETVKQ